MKLQCLPHPARLTHGERHGQWSTQLEQLVIPSLVILRVYAGTLTALRTWRNVLHCAPAVFVDTQRNSFDGNDCRRRNNIVRFCLWPPLRHLLIRKANGQNHCSSNKVAKEIFKLTIKRVSLWMNARAEGQQPIRCNIFAVRASIICVCNILLAWSWHIDSAHRRFGRIAHLWRARHLPSNAGTSPHYRATSDS